ncbi:uncharacterized protein C8Q71DRAFT_846429 [Rhodofomes roseus]|uniref:ABC-type glycine betaine transport system substrate-binding domain-containing protein n=1 Tax=Rhodofomes roseus TaxID=34475 RepID=A0ABQ8KNR4_9APHY|nr:uncharacterized protein C8Q71DRAFT_846429 [Rhodofomes roseus]KAH9839859.1 hypothetical protein C8Q71DRAFT_846429 [Rhodofomes roseus]
MEPDIVVQGVIDLTFQVGSGPICVEGHLEAPHEQAFIDLAEGRTQILVGWLPGSHETHLASFRSEVLVLGEEEGTPAVYDPYCIWASPTMSQRRRLQGINPGAGISRFSKEIISRYGLPLGFVEGDIPKCCAAFEEAYAKKVAKSIAAKLPDRTIEALRKLCISNEGVTQMDYLHAVEGMSPDEAAAKWIAESELQL